MRIVDQASIRPFRCAVIPYIGNKNARMGFIDTGNTLDLDHVYISIAEAGVQIAQTIGWHPPSVVRDKDAEIASLKARVEQIEAELAEADHFRESIDYLSKDGQLKPYKKGGRKPKETTTAKAA